MHRKNYKKKKKKNGLETDTKKISKDGGEYLDKENYRKSNTIEN